MIDHERDDYLDGSDGAPGLEHNERAPEIVRRIVADPDDESAWLAYSAELADNGHDDEALIVQMLWPALRDSLLKVRSFDAVMADVRRNRTLLHALAARQVNDPTRASTQPAGGPKWTAIVFGIAAAVLIVYIAIVFVPTVLGPK